MIRFRFDGSIRESLSSRGSTPTERENVSTLSGSGNAAGSLEWVDRFNRLIDPGGACPEERKFRTSLWQSELPGTCRAAVG